MSNKYVNTSRIVVEHTSFGIVWASHTPNQARLSRLFSVPYPKPSLTENTVSESHTPNKAELRTLSNIERGAQPRVQYYWTCSERSSLYIMGTSLWSVRSLLYIMPSSLYSVLYSLWSMQSYTMHVGIIYDKWVERFCELHQLLYRGSDPCMDYIWTFIERLGELD